MFAFKLLHRVIPPGAKQFIKSKILIRCKFGLDKAFERIVFLIKVTIYFSNQVFEKEKFI